ncbi:hypothetical protein GCM10011613_22400 [Cellvibrio zantedeschiae]|uniref:Solute-binding protein family 3/N-terminal domain-containing protein n=1 Tax=Cellvibrio zantedeschiae TaxID=1237077 RepID=A0ABQ3B391_9GAMM|nr:hypothetical protein [Cellvibrio zantedeschiae]GGY77379.1 hypothetical protein GCM10011613_22400 [Cellvibrio zantedeschiae]
MRLLAFSVTRFGKLAIFCTGLFIAKQSLADVLTITIPPLEQSAQTSIYYPKLLQLALSKTEATDGPFKIVQYPTLLTKARFEAELKRQGKGIIDVMWATTNSELESTLLPIRISLLKDLTSYRIFLIRKEDQEKFNKVKTLDDLRKLKAGQGMRWTDTNVLKVNDLPVVTSPMFEPLFNMLLGKRFDYFPRGLDEIWNEEKLFSDKGIAIEQHIMLSYVTLKYFFVSPNNPKLADRIERGLKIAIADGSFNQLFYSIPGYKRGYEEIANKDRLVLKLKPLK